METFRKLRAQEMSQFDIEKYMMSDKANKIQEKEKAEDYDSDLDRTLYQEFWSDLRTIHKKDKKPNTLRNSKSVMRGAGGPNLEFAGGS